MFLFKSILLIFSVTSGMGLLEQQRKLAVDLAETSEILIDCLPEYDKQNQSLCDERKCNWAEPSNTKAPWCTMPNGYGYEVDGDAIETDLGFVLNLKWKSGQESLYGGDVRNIRLSVECWSENILRIKFDDPNNFRYEVPIQLEGQPVTKPSNIDYQIVYANDPQFGISVCRKSTGTTIFDTDVPGFIFSDQFLQITTSLASSNLYGFGEQTHGQFHHDLNWRLWSMFNADTDPNADYNLAGSQPIYMNIENDGNANGVLLFNSNAMEVILQPAPAVTFRTIGGVLDFYIFLGPTPEEVVQQLTSLIGLPFMPSYWFLGYQVGRDYLSTDEIRSSMQSLLDNQIPYDVQVTGQSALTNEIPFTINTNGFSDLVDLLSEIVANELHYQNEFFPFVLNSTSYAPYKDAIDMNILSCYSNGTAFLGLASTNNFYIDFSHPNASEYWTKQFFKFYNSSLVDFDVINIYFDHPYNMRSIACDENNYNYPPYTPHITNDGNLFKTTMCMDVVHYDGLHYDFHNLYGHKSLEVTYQTLRTVHPNRRPNIGTSSQFAGSGKYAAHMIEDFDGSSWNALKDSIPIMLEFNLFGIPMTATYICGQQKDTTVELCIRWTQVGAFYPYAFTYNYNGNNRDPPSLGPDMVAAAQKAYTERYRLLPYLYSLLHDAHMSGGTVIRSLVHEFPYDANTWDNEYSFLWGPALYVSPVVTEGASSVDTYFPEDSRWYNYYTGVEITNGSQQSIDSPLDGNIALHIRGGYIIPYQEPDVNTKLSRQNPFGLFVALDKNGQAEGSLFYDDGDSADTDESNEFNQIIFAFQKNGEGSLLYMKLGKGGGMSMDPPLDTVKVYGYGSEPSVVLADGTAIAFSSISYNLTTNVLVLANLGLHLPDEHMLNIQ